MAHTEHILFLLIQINKTTAKINYMLFASNQQQLAVEQVSEFS